MVVGRSGGSYHRVARGETLQRIATAYSVPGGAERIWSDPRNSVLRREQGRTRDTLAEGDLVYIPVVDPAGTVEVGDGGSPVRTGRSHQFTSPQTQEVVIQWLDHLGRPATGRSYALDYGGHCHEPAGDTGDDGIIRLELPLRVRNVTVNLTAPSPTGGRAQGSIDEFMHYHEIPQPVSMTFFIGDLDPPTAETRGLWQRLTNLGYYDESVDVAGEGVTERHRHVIREFQRSFEDLETSGEFDDQTITKIREIYESAETDRSFRPARGACHMRIEGPAERALAPTRHNTVRIPSALESMGVSGAGIFFRLIRSNGERRRIYNPIDEIVAAFDFVLVPFINKRRARVNRRDARSSGISDDDYCQQLRSRGVTIAGWDWLPNPGNWEEHLAEAIAHTAAVGGRGWIVDAEVEWKNIASKSEWHATAWREAERYIEFARPLCREHRLWFGFTSFPKVDTHRQLPYSTFVGGTDMSIPQTYDKDGNYRANYFEVASAGYLEHGGKAMLAGSGTFDEVPNPNWRPPESRPPGYDTDTKKYLHPWRDREHYERHLGTMPDFADSIVAWVPRGSIPPHIRQLVVQWRERRGIQ